MAKTLIGSFAKQSDVDTALEDLRDHGYTPEQISFVVKEKEKVREKTVGTSQNLASGAVSGAVAGGVLAGLAGLLVGLGAIAVPGIGALFIGGPLAATLGLSGVVAAGGLLGGLVGLGLPEETARVYEQQIKEGGAVLAVPVDDDEQEEVRELFNKHNGDHVHLIS